jgi:ribosomal protein S18 acetylase RimI-like enzyme
MAFRITEARWPDDRAIVEALFREYIASLTEDISFQNPDDELAGLPGKYARPGGVVLIAWDGAEAAGAIAYRMFEPGVAEMKRLYVRPAYRGRSLGRELANELIDDARARGYRTIMLDTLESMGAARTLYRDLGFAPVEPYYDNPLPGVMYMALELE